MSVPVVLALGANLADPAQTLQAAVRELSELCGLQVGAVSPLFVTTPVGGPDQPDYLNAVVLASTTRSPWDLLQACQGIETRHGRERSVRWGPRTMDIDLVAVGVPGSPGEVVQADPELTLPHPRAHERAFVLAPWAALDPAARLRLPDGTLGLVQELLANAPDREGVRRLAPSR